MGGREAITPGEGAVVSPAGSVMVSFDSFSMSAGSGVVVSFGYWSSAMAPSW